MSCKDNNHTSAIRQVARAEFFKMIDRYENGNPIPITEMVHDRWEVHEQEYCSVCGDHIREIVRNE